MPPRTTLTCARQTASRRPAGPWKVMLTEGRRRLMTGCFGAHCGECVLEVAVQILSPSPGTATREGSGYRPSGRIR